MDQYLKVDQWQKKPEKEPKKDEEKKGGSRGESKGRHQKPAAKINENDPIFGDSGCQIDRDHQDHTAFGIEIDQNLRFQKGWKHSQKIGPPKVGPLIYLALY